MIKAPNVGRVTDRSGLIRADDEKSCLNRTEITASVSLLRRSFRLQLFLMF